jgi:hypothetical protein
VRYTVLAVSRPLSMAFLLFFSFGCRWIQRKIVIVTFVPMVSWSSLVFSYTLVNYEKGFWNLVLFFWSLLLRKKCNGVEEENRQTYCSQRSIHRQKVATDSFFLLVQTIPSKFVMRLP